MIDLNSLVSKYSTSPSAIRGAGHGKSDSVPAVLKKRGGEVVAPAALSDGEFVLTAPAVSNVGGGSTEAGFRFFENFMKALEEMEPEEAAELGELITALVGAFRAGEQKEEGMEEGEDDKEGAGQED